ncbi:hypothetical protein CFP65_0754 [Kitasatospora sp. MMS16-BH015]|uniref:4'-phosphopantetheinyl transferase family protein n=1 Tax=Kitasatospora sp. MMS16-BH015 TaxID=2018025 RepID=UPI000CA3ECB9|nr:4'-phosphopantetheinyl transferase superfamily protein [Kitasatospora sp. MMS16-BH015]AUG75703.1 hypothetical protein CFP65_0754 [Kitasatospora sp. MMS16-BH015]
MRPPPPGTVDLWWIAPGSHWLGSAALSAAELARAGRITEPAVRAAFRRRRGALRSVLAGYTGAAPAELVFRHGPAGRPEVPGAPAFSVSAAGEWAVLAVGAGPVLGVDLELAGQGRELNAVARRFLPALALEQSAPERREAVFLRAWTRYEATLKAAGLGLGGALPPESAGWSARPLAAPTGLTASLVTEDESEVTVRQSFARAA